MSFTINIPDFSLLTDVTTTVTAVAEAVTAVAEVVEEVIGDDEPVADATTTLESN